MSVVKELFYLFNVKRVVSLSPLPLPLLRQSNKWCVDRCVISSSRRHFVSFTCANELKKKISFEKKKGLFYGHLFCTFHSLDYRLTLGSAFESTNGAVIVSNEKSINNDSIKSQWKRFSIECQKDVRLDSICRCSSSGLCNQFSNEIW